MIENKENLEKAIRLKENEYDMLNKTLSTMVGKGSDWWLISEIKDAMTSTMHDIWELRGTLNKAKQLSESLYDKVEKKQHSEAGETSQSKPSVIIKHWEKDDSGEPRLVKEEKYSVCTVEFSGGDVVIEVE